MQMIWGKIGDSFVVRESDGEYILEELVGAGNTYLPKAKYKDRLEAIVECNRLENREKIRRKVAHE